MQDHFIQLHRSFPYKSKVPPRAQCYVVISGFDGREELEIHKHGRKITNKQTNNRNAHLFAIYLSCLLEGGACVMTDVGDGIVG